MLNEEWTRPRGVRLYMDRAYRKYPDSEPFPRDAIAALVPHGGYHASSFDWMLALAVLEGFTNIALYGVSLYGSPWMNGEPLSGRPCLEYWAGVAEGRGARVTINGERSDVFRIVHLARYVSDAQYGFDTEPGLALGNGWRDVR